MTLQIVRQHFAAATAFLMLSSVGASAFAASTTSTSPIPEGPDATMHHGPGDHHHGHGGKGGHHGQCALMDQLNLTQAQKDKMKAVHTRFREENKGTMDSLRAKHEALKALGTDPANEAKRQELRKELREAHHALTEKHHAMMNGILTPQQMEQMKAAKAKCRAEHPRHHHHGEGHGPNAKPGVDVGPKKS